MTPMPSLPPLPRGAARARAPVALLLLVLLVGACTNPFKPADPEAPSNDGVPEKWATPEEVLQTIELALSSRSTNGATAYIRAFAESTVAGDRAFRAFYDGGVKAGWQAATNLTAPEPWDLQKEVGVHSALSAIRPNSTYAFQFGDDDTGAPLDDDPALSDTVQYHRKYTLLATPESGLGEIIAIGYVDFGIQKKDGRWSIYRWVDRVDPNVGVNPAATDQRTMSWWRLESLTLN